MADQPYPTFEQMIATENERLGKLREELLSQRAEIDTQLTQVDNELQAINAYQAIKEGKKLVATTAPKRTVTRRSGRRQEVLDLIAKHPDGIPRAQILEGLGAKGNRSDEQSVSNALSALKKANKIDSRGGLYFTE